jgi:hypothetical protein
MVILTVSLKHKQCSNFCEAQQEDAKQREVALYAGLWSRSWKEF